METRVKSKNFAARQSRFAEWVKSVNEPLFNALNVELERTTSTCLIPHWEVIAASMPGVMKKRSHMGYAETENLNDIHEVFSRVVEHCFVIADKKGWVYPALLINYKFEIEQARERNKSNNLTQSGRILARFNYLCRNKING